MLATLWTRDDVTDSVVDFLPTKTIAVLPIVAKPLRAAQQRVLLTAVRRRGKSVPSPPTTRTFLDTLVIGEPRYFREDWEGGLEQWSERGGHGNTMTEYTVKPFRGGGQCLEECSRRRRARESFAAPSHCCEEHALLRGAEWLGNYWEHRDGWRR